MAKERVQKTLVERVQAVAGSLTSTEQKLISELMRAPREVAIGTSSEFAARLGVHEATTSRLARKLGFSSYGEFRDELRREFLKVADPAERISATLNDARAQGFLPLLVASEMAALTAMTDHISDARILEAAEKLDCRRVFIYGHGNAEVLSVLMERRLRRLGIDSHPLSGSPRDLAEQMLTLSADDALLLFAFRRQPPDYERLMQVAAETRAKTVVISGTIGPSLTPSPDVLLSAPRAGMPDSFQTLTVPMAICNAIILALAERRGPDALATLDRLGDLIAKFES
ncbi:DNA-binding MurR/RpiR family transcriptional regulator [Neorhizobium huautlense]|uniref:DNA-binding MurR/RpiR family transcriptional regulator n=1 Tax=Neorhizobium huautlense TaxID=67774 RepID=A0ABT9PRP9_9HYPH|nr:MurR/RpiR family transcriptional regulator [Neorhizobium huautlense]MDP9837135.1 DNA-binding MurR/RpiR family transcriptional regulator [Neorhizobium huautlense]